MKYRSNQAVYIFGFAVTVLILYLLSSILIPFVLGALLAYLMNPLVKLLQKKGMPHLASVMLVFTLVMCSFLIVLLMLVPLAQTQIQLLMEVAPNIMTRIQDSVMPWLGQYVNWSTIQKSVSTSLPKAGEVVQTVVQSGWTIIEWGVNIVLTPIVAFYLLRDWDKVTDGARSLIPQDIKPTVMQLAHEYDRVLSEFFRGQLLLMLSLCIIYGVGLTIAGLQVGFMIGVIGGLLSIVPYLGSLFVLSIATITSLVQFHTLENLLWVWGVYFVGQALEGYVLTPYLVGDRIGLHPVAVIFAIMAGGVLFGFFGILLALPVAALIMVLFRYIRRKHHAKAEAQA